MGLSVCKAGMQGVDGIISTIIQLYTAVNTWQVLTGTKEFKTPCRYYLYIWSREGRPTGKDILSFGSQVHFAHLQYHMTVMYGKYHLIYLLPA